MINPERVHATVMKHIQDNYSETDVDWPNVNFDTASKNEWIQVSILAQVDSRGRRNQTNRKIYLDINCFTRLSATGPHRVWTIANEVASIFDKGADEETIIMLDSTGYIRFKEPEFRTIIGGEAETEISELAQVLVSIEGQLIA